MSLTIKGLIVMIFGLLLKYLEVELPIESLNIFVEVLLTLGGALTAWYGRYRKGDITILGTRK